MSILVVLLSILYRAVDTDDDRSLYVENGDSLGLQVQQQTIVIDMVLFGPAEMLDNN